MSTTTYAVLGASRGIGLEFVIQLAARPGSTVFAVIRSTKSATHLLKAAANLKNVHVIEGDVGDYASLQRAAEEVGKISGGTLDCLIHNAARVGNPELPFGYEDYSDMNALDADFIEAYKVNTLGVIHGITAFLPLVRASPASLKKIVVVSSGMADAEVALKADLPNMAAYAVTKAATNIATTKWAVRLRPENIVCIAINPGVVDVGGTRGESGDPAMSNGQVQMIQYLKSKGMEIELATTTQSVTTQIKTIDALTIEKTGLFLEFDGREYCWY